MFPFGILFGRGFGRPPRPEDAFVRLWALGTAAWFLAAGVLVLNAVVAGAGLIVAGVVGGVEGHLLVATVDAGVPGVALLVAGWFGWRWALRHVLASGRLALAEARDIAAQTGKELS